MNGIRLPRHILVVQYVGAPLSGDISDDVRGRYTYLRKYGPNDGLTLLADQIGAARITIIEPGVDHFYRDPERDQPQVIGNCQSRCSRINCRV